MTTSTFNKIVRSNFNLKPWILSKNTNEIVSTCVEKIYKQIPNNFKNELLHTKMAAPKPENKAPIRFLRSQERPRAPIVNTPKAKYQTSNMTGEKLLNVVMHNSKRSAGITGGGSGGTNATGGILGGNLNNGAATNFSAQKKLLKSPNYKIYGSRRFGSSASSSNASLFRRYDERRRNRIPTNVNFLRRSFGTGGSASKCFDMGPAVSKYLMQARNQHMESHLNTTPQAFQVSNSIQRDLMIIDNTLKDRISLARHKLSKLTEPKSSDPSENALRGWHHPPAPELFSSSQRLSERSIANAELQEQQRKLKIAHHMKQFEPLRINVDPSRSQFVLKRRTHLADDFKSMLRDTSPRISHQQAAQKLAKEEVQLPTRRYTRRPLGCDPPPPSPPGATTSDAIQLPSPAQPASNATTPLIEEKTTTSSIVPPPVQAPVTMATATSLMAAAVAAAATANLANGRFNRSSFLGARKY